MNRDQALDPLRSLKAVGRTAAAAPAPLLLWWFGGLAALFALYMVFYVSVVALVFASLENREPEPALIAIFVAVGCLFFLVFLCAQLVWQLGFMRVFEEALRTGGAEIATGLGQWRRLPAAIGSQLLVFLITLVLYLPLLALMLVADLADRASELGPVLFLVAIPVGLATLMGIFWVALGLSFALHAVAIDGAGPIEALSRSWALARGRRWRILLFLLATAVFVLAGLLALCVGYVLTGALGILMPTELYLALTRGADYDRYWVSTGAHAEAVGATPPPVPRT